jgi:hypothetical protein
MCLSPTTGKQQQQSAGAPGGGGAPGNTSIATGAVAKKQITPEMKRSRSQGTRNKLQKMHTIQSMASYDEMPTLFSYNLGVSTGSGGSHYIYILLYQCLNEQITKLTYFSPPYITYIYL